MDSLAQVLRLFHTVRYLRPVQVYGRFWCRVYRPAPDQSPAPTLRIVTGNWQPPVPRLPSLLEDGGFRFLNKRHELGASSDWNNPQWDKLWLYNLHYFDDLNAVGAKERADRHRALLGRWLAENPPVVGVGWEPYPISMRVVNWIKWALAANTLEPAWVQSLAVQVRILRRRMEYHLLGNHLFANAKALVFAGLFFRGEEAQRWLDRGLALLDRELGEQVLSDGGHFERSPMYHSVILEDLLDLLNLLRTYPDAGLGIGWEGRLSGLIREMRVWLDVMCHPDGEIALFNDAAFAIASAPEEIDWYAQRMGLASSTPVRLGVRHLAATGYIRLENGPAYLLLDVGRIGPDYIPGHAHADTLSFELSLFGQRLLVNSGTSRYGSGPERERQRGTAAHNTVIVDNRDSSEVWSGFRVARRALPRELVVDQGRDGVVVSCAHDGYTRLPGKPVHRRNWTLREGALSVRDEIDGGFVTAQARFHFHPGVSVEIADGRSRGRVTMAAGQVIHWEIKGGTGELQNTTYHPRFGVTEPNICLCVPLSDHMNEIEFRWG